VMSPAGEVLEFLADGASLCDWLEASAVLPKAMLAEVRRLAPAQQDRLASDLRALREALRGFLFKRSQKGPARMTQADAQFVNLWLSRQPLVQSLVVDKTGWKLELHRDLSSRGAVMAELAAQCADVIAHCPIDQVRQCENPACTMWFNDAKRGPRRRWCSMAICGNRMKVAAHRARQRGDA
jgi:predicted RNA-binding Zn ribbon-like protein